MFQNEHVTTLAAKADYKNHVNDNFFLKLRKMAMEEQHITRGFKSRALRGGSTKAEKNRGLQGINEKGVFFYKYDDYFQRSNKQRMSTTANTGDPLGDTEKLKDNCEKELMTNAKLMTNERTAQKNEASVNWQKELFTPVKLPIKLFPEDNASTCLNKDPIREKEEASTFPEDDCQMTHMSQIQTIKDDRFRGKDLFSCDLQYLNTANQIQDELFTKNTSSNYYQSVTDKRNIPKGVCIIHNTKKKQLKRKSSTTTQQSRAEAGPYKRLYSSSELLPHSKMQDETQEKHFNTSTSKSLKKLMVAPEFQMNGFVKKATEFEGKNAARSMMTTKLKNHSVTSPGNKNVEDSRNKTEGTLSSNHCSDGCYSGCSSPSTNKKRKVENMSKDESNHQTTLSRCYTLPLMNAKKKQCNAAKTGVNDSSVFCPEDVFLLFNHKDQRLFTADQHCSNSGHSLEASCDEYFNQTDVDDKEESLNTMICEENYSRRQNNTADRFSSGTNGLKFNNSLGPALKTVEDSHRRKLFPGGAQPAPVEGGELSNRKLDRCLVEERPTAVGKSKSLGHEAPFVQNIGEEWHHQNLGLTNAELTKGTFDLATDYFKGIRQKYYAKTPKYGCFNEHCKIKRETSRKGTEMRENSECKYLHKRLHALNHVTEDKRYNCSSSKEGRKETFHLNASFQTTKNRATLKYHSFDKSVIPTGTNRGEVDCQGNGSSPTASQQKSYIDTVIDTTRATKPCFSYDKNLILAKERHTENNSAVKGAKRKCLFVFEKSLESDGNRLKRIRDSKVDNH